MTNTIIHITDNSLDPEIATLCQRILVREAQGLPIVSVSQKPIELGTNICVGEIGKCWYSLYRQLLTGAEAVIEMGAKWVAIAEHDVCYSAEHLHYQPSDASVFWYNTNCWLTQWPGSHANRDYDGMFSHWPRDKDGVPRIALSQLICDPSLLARATRDVMRLLDMGLRVEQGLRWHGEPGVVSERFRRAYLNATSGRPIQLQDDLRDYVQGYTAKFFQTKDPTLDIRHTSNFSGPRRGKNRCYELPYWGRFIDVMEGKWDDQALSRWLD